MKLLFSAALICGLLVLPVRAQVAPMITTMSGNRQITEGQNLSLTVSVNGTAPFTYVWKRGGSPIADATDSTYSFDAGVSDSGSYTVTVTNTVGFVTSEAVIIDVIPATPPALMVSPGDRAGVVGGALTLTPQFTGTEPMSYVWRKDGIVIAAGSDASYRIANASIQDSGSYTITATNVKGSTTPSPFRITIDPPSPPRFASGPDSQTINPGEHLSLDVYLGSNSGSEISYQWYKDGTPLPNVTSAHFVKVIAGAEDAGVYTVLASNGAGSTMSSEATVTVRPPPVRSNVTITPGPRTISLGGQLDFSCAFNGLGARSYQWRKNGANIAGATASYYTKSNVTADDAGAYSLVVTTSSTAEASLDTVISVTATPAPYISVQPFSTAVYLGEYALLMVRAYGTTPLSYQWKKNGLDIPGATDDSLRLSPITDADAGVYSLTVSSAGGSTTSKTAVVTVLAPLAPTIIRQPSGVSVLQGQPIQLAIEATGHPGTSFQWKKDGGGIPSATGGSYYVGSASVKDSGSYCVEVTNVAGTVTSQTVTVSVVPAAVPQIDEHPASASLLPGGGFWLLTAFEESGGATVQWQRGGVPLPGATSRSYYIANGQPALAGSYTAVVSNSAGSTTSLPGVITIDSAATRPVIVYTSGSSTVAGGETATLSIRVAAGIGNYTVVWKKDGIIIPNATMLSFNIPSFGPQEIGVYMAEVTTSNGVFTSRPIAVKLQNDGVIPHIAVQPASCAAAIGEYPSFVVRAEGEQPLSYQWRKDGVNIPGATSNFYIFEAVDGRAGSYTVEVTNRNGSAVSGVASLTLKSAIVSKPIISEQPLSQALTPDSTYLSLSVALANWLSGKTSFQWYKDNAAIPGATFSSYSNYEVGANTGGIYRVVVTNPAGSVSSDEAAVTFATRAPGLAFATRPANQSGLVGATVSFTAAATSNFPLSYQWKKSGVDISGATDATLTLANLKATDVGAYTIVASDAAGRSVSAVALLTVELNGELSIMSQPLSQTGVRSGSVSFSVIAKGSLLTYQWKKDGADIPGATQATLSLSSLSTTDAGYYSVVVGNSRGSLVSDAARLIVVDQGASSAPRFTVQPQSRTYMLGETVTLRSSVSGLPTPAVQWYKDGVPISGARNEDLPIGQMSSGTEGAYYVIAVNELGSATSNVATLTLGTGWVRLVNVSCRGTAGKDANTLIAGLVINGSVPKQVMIRAIGPSLLPLGVNNALVNPQLRLFKGSTQILENDDWSTAGTAVEISAAAARLGAFGLTLGTADAAFITQLDPGAYTAHVTTADASTGVVLLEVYDADENHESNARVVNLSSRGLVGTGDDILIVGFVINGSAPKKVLVRGIGPALTPQGVTGALADPTLQLYAGSKLINENDNWSAGSDGTVISNAAMACGAAALALGSKDAAILVELQPGVYTAHVRGVGATTGVALVEVYEVP